MAVTSTISYCTDQDLKDIFPGLSGHDSKVRVYNWQTTGTSNLYLARDVGLVTQLFSDGEDLGSAEANSGVVNANGEWYYDSDLDTVYYFDSATAPNNRIMESGEDWATLKTRQRRNASRYLESKMDQRMAREIWKDREGDYPYIVVRTTALISVVFLIRAEDPNNEISDAFWEEAQDNINQLNSGTIQLPSAVTMDSSKGYLRDVTYTADSIRPVDTRGHYYGTYDLLKIKITTGGVLGTATYSVWEKDSTQLKNNKIVTDKIVDGDYQQLASGLQIRFAGGTDSSTAANNDEWEMAVHGAGEAVDTKSFQTIAMTRGGSHSAITYSGRSKRY